MPVVQGFKARVVLGNTILRAYRWSVNFKTDEFDVTTFENNGYDNWTFGLVSADISVDAFYDPFDNPFAGGLKVLPTTTGSLTLQTDKSVAQPLRLWSFPLVLIGHVSHEQGVRDVSRISFSCRNVNANYPLGAGGEATAAVPTFPVN